MMLKTIIFAVVVAAMIPDSYQLPRDGSAKTNDVETKIRDINKNLDVCIDDIIDMTSINKDIEDVKNKKSIENPFKKYCAKASTLKTCLHTWLDALTSALETGTRKQVSDAKKNYDTLIDFACYNDGERIVQFISDGSLDCFKRKDNELVACQKNAKTTPLTLTKIENVSSVERCESFTETSACFADKFETCAPRTPNNLVDSFVRFLRNMRCF